MADFIDCQMRGSGETDGGGRRGDIIIRVRFESVFFEKEPDFVPRG